MSEDNCLLEIAKLAGRELEEKEKKQITSFVKKIVDKVSKEDLPGILSEKVLKELDKVMLDAKTKAFIDKRTTAINYKKRIDAQKKIEGTYSKDYALGLQSIIGEARTAAEGSKDTLHANIAAEKGYQIPALVAKLEKQRLTDTVRLKENQKDLFYAMYELGSKNADEKFLATLNPDIVEAARILNEGLELSRTRFNKAGGFIGKQESYVMKQSHDQNKIAKAAGDYPIGDIRHKEKWVNRVTELLDMEKTYPHMTPEEKLAKISEDYDAFSSGIHLRYESDTGGFKGPSSIAGRYTKSRSYQFKNKEAAHAYWQEFGIGENIFGNVTSQISRIARDTAIMNKLGVNAESNIEKLVSTLEKKLEEQGRRSEIKKLRDTYNDLMKRVWPNMTDSLSSSPDNLFSEVMGLGRNWTYTTTLGSAVLSQISDFAFAGSTYRYVTGRGFGDMINGITQHIGNMMEGMSKGEKLQMEAQLGIMSEAMTALPSRYDADAGVPGQMSKYLETVNKLNGIEWWQRKSRIAGTGAFASLLDGQKAFAWADLKEGTQSYMRQFGITETEWNVLRKVQSVRDHKGRSLFSPVSVREIPLEKLDVLPEVQARIKSIESKKLANSEKLINAARENARDRLHNKVGSMFAEYSHMVATEPGAIDRALLNQGTKRGTWEGELLRAVTMFKSFPATITRKHFARELYGYHDANVSIPQAFKRLFDGGEGGKGIKGIASIVAVAPIFGYISLALKDISKGIIPRYPDDPKEAFKIYLAAANQSGGAALFGDFLFGEKTRYGQGLGQALLGPLGSNILTAGDLATSALHGARDVNSGELKDTGAKAASFLMNQIPGKNLFFARYPFDLLLGYRIQELVNDGSLQRRERRLWNEQGQKYFVSPSEIVK